MQDSNNIDNFLKSFTEQAKDLLQAQTASLWLQEKDKIVLRAASGYSSDIQIVGALSYDLNTEKHMGLTAFIAQGNPFRGKWQNIKTHPAWRGKWDDLQYQRGPALNSLLGVPILLDNKPIGVLKVENKRGEKSFSEADQKLLETIADLIATTLKTRPEYGDRIFKAYIFVLMPFSNDFNDIYELGIKSTAEKLGVHCERVDEIEFNDTILLEIYAGIQRADLVIADMTGRNPNVFYEVGYAHALSKDVVLLTQKIEDIPFDLKGHNHIVYEKSITKLQTRLEKRLRSLLEKL